MFLHGNEHTVFDVSSGRREAIGGADAIAGDGGFTKIGAGKLVLRTTDSYSGGTILKAGTLALKAHGAAGTGAITFRGAATLEVTNAALSGHALDNVIKFFDEHDVLDLTGLGFAIGAIVKFKEHKGNPGQLTVHSGHVTDTFTLLHPQGTHFVAASDGHGGTEITLASPPVGQDDWTTGGVGSTHHMADHLIFG